MSQVDLGIGTVLMGKIIQTLSKHDSQTQFSVFTIPHSKQTNKSSESLSKTFVIALILQNEPQLYESNMNILERTVEFFISVFLCVFLFLCSCLSICLYLSQYIFVLLRKLQNNNSFYNIRMQREFVNKMHQGRVNSTPPPIYINVKILFHLTQ